MKYRRTCMIFYLSRNLSGILFVLYYLLQPLEEMKLLVLLFIQIGLRWSNFHRTLSRHLELCVLFTLDCLDFILLSTIETFSFCSSSSINEGVNCSWMSTNRLHTVIDFLPNKVLNIPNFLYMKGNFNVK